MPKLTVVLTIILVILLFDASAGQTVIAENNDVITSNVIKGRSRKVLTEIMDYDYGWANPKHDPRRRPGIGGKNR